jgi:NAD(P)-dependent dehydrogenase (short-subunit alcohol dehydrogenase family)
MMDSFTGKVFAVTGVSGIGLSVAKQLRKRGALLSLADVNQKSLDEAFQQLGGLSDCVMTSVVDIGTASEVNSWIDATISKFGRLDGAANMSGVIGKHHGIRKITEQDDDEWDLIMRVNITGLMYCLRAELRNMSPGGSIVNAASVQGIMGFAKHAAYSASKHGVIGLTRSVAKESAPNIRVNAIAP